MTTELALHPNGEITVTFGDEEYHLPRPKFGQKNRIAAKVENIGSRIQSVSSEIIGRLQEEYGVTDEQIDAVTADEEIPIEGDSERTVDADKLRSDITSALMELDNETFTVLFGVWVEIIEILSGKKLSLSIDDAPLWVGQIELLNSVTEHWNTNPLASSPSRPTLTTVQ